MTVEPTIYEEVFYSEEVDERVAKFIVEHGGKVQTERVDPGHVFHKVTIQYTSYRRVGGGDHSQVYEHILAGGARLLIQTLMGRGRVPGYPDEYWHAFYIYREDADGDTEQRRRTCLSDGTRGDPHPRHIMYSNESSLPDTRSKEAGK